MTGLRRALGLFVSVAAFALPSHASAVAVSLPDELSDTFGAAIDLLHRGRKAEALAQLKRVAAMSPDQAAAYELWTKRDYADWRDLLVEGGDFQLIAQRLMDLARTQRKALVQDKDAILALVRTATTPDETGASRAAVRTLVADHGVYAVPHLVNLLGDGSGERATLAMHALSQFGIDASPVVAEALRSDDPAVRRNAAFVLGNLGGPHAVAALQHTAAADADPVVKEAAAAALSRSNAQGSALASFLTLGDGYWKRSDQVLARGEASDVVWDWKDGQVVGTPIPRELFGSEMSKRAFYDALRVDPTSVAALAGLARAYVDGQTRVDALVRAGADVGAWKDSVGSTLIAVNGAGVEALDNALVSAVQAGDASTAVALCRVLAPLAGNATNGLRAALAASDGATQSEAAVALAQIAARSGQAAGPEVVATLGRLAGQEVNRLALVIDSDAVRGNAMAEALRGVNTYATVAELGSMGLVMARRAPGLDLVVVADSLGDMTTAQVVDELRGDSRLGSVPVFVLTTDKDATAAAYADRIAGTTGGAGDLDPLRSVLDQPPTGDRQLALDLAARSASALAHLGTSDDLGPALSGLATATVRDDTVAIPAMAALAARGTAAQAPALLAVLVDEQRTEGARAAAGAALARVVGRNANAIDGDGVAKVEGVVRSEAPMSVREAAARVIGSVAIPAAERARLLEKLRS